MHTQVNQLNRIAHPDAISQSSPIYIVRNPQSASNLTDNLTARCRGSLLTDFDVILLLSHRHSSSSSMTKMSTTCVPTTPGKGLQVIHVALYCMGTKSCAEAYKILGYKAHHALNESVFESPWAPC